MKVLKFGGTSVGTADRIRTVAEHIRKSGRNIVVLLSLFPMAEPTRRRLIAFAV